MLAVFPYSLKDQALALNLASWIRELAGGVNASIGHNFLIVVDGRVDGLIRAEIFAKLKDLENSNSVEEIVVTDDVDNKWPESPNLMVRKAAKHIEYGTKEPWIWLEPDTVPLKKSWLNEIEAEYKVALGHGKVFLGDYVHTGEPGFIDHCSGVAVYPGVMSDHAGELLMAHEIAWDCWASGQILPQMHKSKLILHRWKYPAFQTWEQVEQRIFAVKPDCVLFHSDKHGSLIPLLREQRKEGDATCPTSTMKPAVSSQSTPISQILLDSNAGPKFKPEGSAIPTCDIFIKSFPGDYEWLRYCLRSISKFATGFRRVIVVIPSGTRDELTSHIVGTGEPLLATTTVIEVDEPLNGYLFQQVCKLNADKYTDASHVLFLDSDCVFTRPVTPETFTLGGKIMWLMTPIDKAREDQRLAWMPVMTKWMNKAPEFEFMHRHPFMFPRWFFEKIRGFCASQHSQALDNYILKQPGRTFSEFNCAGFLAYEHFRDRFEWINTETDQVPPATVLQNWSPAGLTEAIKVKLEAILKSEQPLTESFSSASAIVAGINGDTSRETLVRDAVAVLKQLCTSPVHTGKVRKELKAQGVTR